jgi:membrane fusion protein (multidrug efflux system)
LRAAKIQLGYTKIYSPIDGIIGKTKAKVGDFVGREPNPVILNTVSQVDTILVTFYITETQYLTIARFLAKELSEEQEGESNLELILVDGSVYDHKGNPTSWTVRWTPPRAPCWSRHLFPIPKNSCVPASSPG